MGKKVECYLDCVSPYSFHAFTYLRKNAEVLASHGVEIEYIPVFLGGINVGSGNNPPWTLPAKARYAKYDGARAQRYFGHTFEVPSFFPILSLLPQRALTYIEQSYPSKLEPAFLTCFEAIWYKHIDISTPENLQRALAAQPAVFSDVDIKEILNAADTPEIKAQLTSKTERVVNEQGAFGCPWFWVVSGEGIAEPFFGSDRFHYMWDFLELPREHLKLEAKANARL